MIEEYIYLISIDIVGLISNCTAIELAIKKRYTMYPKDT